MRLFFSRCYSGGIRPKLFSQIFRSKEAVPKENVETPTSSKSFKLMLQHGFISSSSSGIYNLLPLTMMSLEKLCCLVDYTMESIGGQKVLLPTLAHKSLWEKSGRWNNENAHLFKLKDRHSVEYCLGPTHEEIVTKAVASSAVSLKTLPLRVYQISTKFRDEVNPRLGLLRGREFLMKDMYTFDITEENAKSTYFAVCDAYNKLFQLLDVNCVRVQGSSSGMGGSISHEYHFISDAGEDEILYCSKCKMGMNVEVSPKNEVNCSKCDSALERSTAIEVGHTFILGTTYTDPFEAKFKDQDGIMKVLHMGCYGLGITRILAASIECLAVEGNIRWPLLISPFLLSIIPPKKGSKEEKANYFADFLVTSLSTISILSDAIVVDDRIQFSIGKRIEEAKYIGIPYVLVAGSTVLESVPKVEVIDVYNNREIFMTHAEVMSFFREVDQSLSSRLNLLKEL